jgi:hypothetical protein
MGVTGLRTEFDPLSSQNIHSRLLKTGEVIECLRSYCCALDLSGHAAITHCRPRGNLCVEHICIELLVRSAMQIR